MILKELKSLNTKFDDQQKCIKNISRDIATIKGDLNCYKTVTDSRIKKLEDTYRGVTDSQEFISKTFENNRTSFENECSKNKKVTDDIRKNDSIRESEVAMLNGELNVLQNDLKQERIGRNSDAQYNRSSYMVEFNGLKRMPDEHDDDNNTVKSLVVKVARLADFKNFNPDQIDMCHRIGGEEDAPIIVTFGKKCHRMNFYSQKKNLLKLDRRQFTSCFHNEEETFPNDAGDPLDRRDPDTYVYLNESLTPLNNKLMKEARKLAKSLGYKYRYTYKGEIRVRKKDDSRFISVKCYEDLEKIV